MNQKLVAFLTSVDKPRIIQVKPLTSEGGIECGVSFSRVNNDCVMVRQCQGSTEVAEDLARPGGPGNRRE